jgi:hypothetical protein
LEEGEKWFVGIIIGIVLFSFVLLVDYNSHLQRELADIKYAYESVLLLDNEGRVLLRLANCWTDRKDGMICSLDDWEMRWLSKKGEDR